MPAAPALDIVKQLIGFDTTSRHSNRELIDFARSILEGAGARVRLTEDATGTKANLFATLGPETDGGIVLSGHTDVVPVDGQNWSSDPFTAEIRDGRLYGRGSADMKGFVGTALSLVPSFAAAPLKRPLHFAFSYDEEIGCVGVRSLLADLREQEIKPALAVIGEPTSMRVVGAHKSGAVMETTALGREHHSSAPARGANAVMMAGEFIAALAAYGEELKRDRDDYFDPPYTTVQATMISGGTAVNILAGEASVVWDCRALPDRDRSVYLKQVQARADEILARYRQEAPRATFRTDMRVSFPGLVRDLNSPAVQLACRLTGDNDVHAVSYGTEAGLFQAAGIAAVVCGPGSIHDAHRADEFIELDQLDACDAFIRRIAQEACS
jgi:acetylornithine deacetylase